MKPLIIIPSRLASTRLSNKPLADIHGKPMIVHVYERAKAANIADVIVACCSTEIKEPLEKIGATVFLTPKDLASGTDRIHHALTSFDSKQTYDVIINLQGDLPTVTKECLEGILKPLKRDNIDISTLVTPISEHSVCEDPNVVKAAVSQDRAFYFSRAPIPSQNNKFYHHVGVYGYKRQALEKFVSLPPSSLENSEKLEQLRALEAGMRFGIHELNETLLSVDTQHDLDRVRQLMKPSA